MLVSPLAHAKPSVTAHGRDRNNPKNLHAPVCLAVATTNPTDNAPPPPNSPYSLVPDNSQNAPVQHHHSPPQSQMPTQPLPLTQAIGFPQDAAIPAMPTVTPAQSPVYPPAQMPNPKHPQSHAPALLATPHDPKQSQRMAQPNLPSQAIACVVLTPHHPSPIALRET